MTKTVNRPSRFKLIKDLNTDTLQMVWFDKGNWLVLWTWPLSEWTYIVSHPEIIPLPEPVEAESEEHLLGLA